MHGMVARILALPMVYGIMSLQGVVRMWGISANYVSRDHRFNTYKDRMEYHTDMFEAALMVGDIYESFALYMFGRIVMLVLKEHIGAKQVASLKDLGPSGRTSTVLFELNKSVGDLIDRMKALALLGIRLFCITCTLQAVYMLILTATEWELGMAASKNVLKDSARDDYTNIFYGAGFVASCAAIGNLVGIETGFHEELEGFGAFLKFWGTKVLVSIAYMQKIAIHIIPPFSSLTKTRQTLLYCSLLTLQCFIVSLVHLYAWRPQEKWYFYSVPEFLDELDNQDMWSGMWSGKAKEDTDSDSSCDETPSIKAS